MATYLITGGCGFIGSHLADALLRQNHEVRVLDNLSTGKRQNASDKCKIIEGDICDYETVLEAMEGVDGCFHLAAIASVEKSTHDWLGSHKVNLGGAITVMEAAKQASVMRKIPVVYASSAAVYGNLDAVALEHACARPLTAYGADKLGCENHARMASAVHGIPTVGFRFFNVYGPRQDPSSPYSGVLSIFLDQLKGGRPVTIYGDGQQVRDFIYVGDVVRFLIAGMRTAGHQPQVYNVCTGKATSIHQLVHIIGAAVGETPVIRYREARKGDIRLSVGNPYQAFTNLGIRAETDLQTGLGAMMMDNQLVLQ